jgi:DNA-binding NtrC family response regulator
MIPSAVVSIDASGDGASEPAIVMVASGTQAAGLVLPPSAELGRRVAAAGRTQEITDERMSRDHATVRRDQDLWVVTDLDSRNGTYIDGERVVGETRRRGAVVLRLGHTVFALLPDGRGQPAADGDPIIGPELARAHAQLREAAARAAPVLLLYGEPGSGKELAARAFHAAGPRAAGPFVAVNCAAIPEGVAPRLLFGGTKGAINTIGHLQMARGGTLFLDEIADLDAAAQQELERVLAQGAPELAIVAGAHELRSAVSEKRFGEGLYQRLLARSVQLPPLRMRKVDIARLVQHEVSDAAARLGATLAPHAKLIETCMLRFWPGNVRELRATVKHAAGAAAADGRDTVRVEDLPETAGLSGGTASGETAVERPKNASPEIDRATLVAALARANGVVSVAARALGVHRSQLYKLMEQHGIVNDV